MEKMLDAELLEVLTAGDMVGMEEMLSRQDHGAGNGRGQTEGQVAINVHGAAPDSFLLGVASNLNTALHLVASRGHVELATLLCERVPTLVARRNKCLDTPLHCAAKSGHSGVSAVLLSRMRAGGEEEKSALRARNQTGATALYEAVRHRHGDVVDLLMEEAPGLASVDGDEGISPLYLAASTCSVRMVRALLRPSHDGTTSPASFSGPEGRTALHAAAAVSKEIVQAILGWEKGSSLLTKVDSSGRTPLHFAALHGRLDVVELFLDDDHASLRLASISDKDGSFPVHAAVMMGNTSTVLELITESPDFYKQVDNQGKNLLHRAVEQGQHWLVRHICENDDFAMLLNATDSHGNTPLHLAVNGQCPGIFCSLLATPSVDMGITNKDGLTVSDLSSMAGVPGRIYYFLDPWIIVTHCLYWLRAPRTRTPDTANRVADKPATDDAPETRQNYMTTNRSTVSALIATVTFAAAFTVPGGFVADDRARAGTAILARRFAFRAFVVSDTMAFICSIVATCFDIYGGAQEIPKSHRRRYKVLAVGHNR